jgi:hypothetical protein
MISGASNGCAGNRTPAQGGNHTRDWRSEPSVLVGWENPLKAIVIQWRVFGGLEVITH